MDPTRRKPLASRWRSLVVALGVAVAAPPLAVAEADQSETLWAGQAVPRSCFEKPLGNAPGVDSVKTTAPVTGLVRARLTGPGDWDVAVFDKKTGAVVAASAGLRTNEVADGYVTKDQELVVQGCRYGGNARTAQLRIGWTEVQDTQAAQRMQVVDVDTPTRADKRRLQALGVDLTEGGGEKSLQVLLHGPEDERKLREAGFTWKVRIPDLKKHVEANARADQRYAQRVARSLLPSGRTSYRHLYEYEYEIKELARRYPTLARPFILPRQSVEGRDIHGIEIAVDARHIHDGKPVFLNMGVHHAREWPSGEHAMEWAYELLTGYGKDARITSLVRATRNVVIPVVNPDGFTISREAPAKGDFSVFDYEMKRKNCQAADSPPDMRVGVCADNPAGRLRGVDLNRNYPGFWGGPGASANWRSDTFRGSAPGSEPEVRAVREFISQRQVTTLITNHTYSNLILRPPGVYDARPPLDEPTYAALGQRMADHNGYTSEPSWKLYDTTGSTEDWSFWNTGGFGFTFEIGPSSFHPPFETGVVAEYAGLPPAAGAGKGGNRAAYLEMLQATADPAYHAVITGTAPEGWKLRVHKEFATPTSPVLDSSGKAGEPIMYEDVLDSSYIAPGGEFAFHVNPSTRPYVAGRYGRDPVAPPSPPYAFENPPGQPAENTGDPLSGPHEEVPFTVEGPPRADNAKVTVHIEWNSPDTDWDLYIVDADGTIVAQSATGGTREENAVLADPAPGQYKAVIVNYDQVDGQPFDDWTGGKVTFENPKPTTTGVKEAWTFTCERPNGKIASVRSVIVDRGRTVDLGDACRQPGKRPRR
ncbi:M14 family zinc carboxypeptidase [Carbonactinospora thermoautotrophica]|uniref:M14 family zinc carboxypeptidase n=1 Tax=Carbonactinospora thermoautotrophica TaxID=1469144 RepID=UPI0008335E5D|nr:M14 family zinc carboxypeptidase [Carbonactinospora thermoautotrophica]